MKICPFVSHMLGDDNSNSWTIEGGSIRKTDSIDKPTDNVVVLGYEDSSSQSDTMTEIATETETSVPSHLHCLKEACRFYQDKTTSCQFDMIFSMLKEPKKPSAKDDTRVAKNVSKELAKDIDKIWQFQTKSVEELIKSYGETEKTQAASVTSLKKDIEKSISSISSKTDKSGLADIKKNLNALKKKIEDREQSTEDLSSTMSELVLNIHESITKLEKRSEDSVMKIERLSESIPNESALKQLIENNAPNESELRKLIEESIPHKDDLKQWVEESSPHQKDLEQWVRDSVPHEDDLRRWIEESIESKNASWREELANQINDIQDQQQTWEDEFKRLADYHEEILERLDDVVKTSHNERGRNGQKEAKKYNNLGVASFHNAAYEMARDQFLQAVQLDSEFSEAYNNLGLAYTELDEEDKASEAFSRAIELNPELHAAYNNLGYIHFKKGDYDQAIEMYNEALGRSTHNSSAYTNLGNAYYKLDRIEDAKDAWGRALEIDPGNEKAKRNLDRIGGDAE